MRSSSEDQSVGVPSKDPDEVMPWEHEGWRALYVPAEFLDEDRGGYGRVVRAVQRSTGVAVALKHPRTMDADVLGRFRREIEWQKAIDSDFVVPILDHGEALDWYTMPIALHTAYDVAGTLFDADIALLLKQAALGLRAAHSRELLHRDVKPTNLLMMDETAKGYAWAVSDFGLVKPPPGRTGPIKTTGPIGTPGFMAPEMEMDGARLTPATDVYGLGRVLAWLSTGALPQGYSAAAGGGRWSTLVGRMTAFNPKDRLPDMDAVIDEADRALSRMRNERNASWRARGASGDVMLDDDDRVLVALLEQSRTPAEPGEHHVWTGYRLELPTVRAVDERASLRKLVLLGLTTEVQAVDGNGDPCTHLRINETAWDYYEKNRPRLQVLREKDEAAARDASARARARARDDIPF